MGRAYVVFALAATLLFGYASWTGVSFIDAFRSGKWGPAGRSAFHK